MVEVFLDIKGYEGLYQVSNYGRVRSLNYKRTGEVRVLKAAKDKAGYLQIGLCKNGKQNWRKVHRFVAEAFIPNPDNLPEVNHIDEDKSNNCVWNLEWCTRKYNVNYGTRTEQTSTPVYQYTKDSVFVKEYPSIREASRQTGINRCNIASCCRGYKYKSAGGYVWSFNPPE